MKRTLGGMIANVQRTLRSVNVPIMEIHQAIETAHKDVHLSFHWPWTYKDTNLLIQAPYTTGAISITDGTATVVGSGTTWDTSWIGMRMQFGTNNVDYQVSMVTSPTTMTLSQPVNLGVDLVDSTYTLYKDTYTLPADCDVDTDIQISIQQTQIVVRHIPRYTFENYALSLAQSSTSMTQFYTDTEFDEINQVYRIRFMPPISTVGEYRLTYRRRPADLGSMTSMTALPEGYDEVLELMAAARLMSDHQIPGADQKKAEATGKLRLMRRQVESAMIDNQPGYGQFGLPDQTNLDDYFTAMPWAGGAP